MELIVSQSIKPICIAGLLFILTGCASYLTDDADWFSEDSGWQSYRDFEYELKHYPANVNFKHHVSTSIQGKIKQARSQGERLALKLHAAYPLWLVEEHAHYVKKTARGSCLTVNGITREGNPGSVSVEYVLEDKKLKADKVQYDHLESTAEFPSDARCPMETE